MFIIFIILYLLHLLYYIYLFIYFFKNPIFKAQNAYRTGPYPCPPMVLHNLRQGNLVVPSMEVGWRTKIRSSSLCVLFFSSERHLNTVLPTILQLKYNTCF